MDDVSYAARIGDVEELRRALKDPKRLSLTVDEETGNTPLHMACANGHLECVKLILEDPIEAASLNAKNASGNTPLHWTCLNGHRNIVEMLIQAGADPLIENNAGLDALFEAENNGREEVIEWLLAHVDYQAASSHGEEQEEADGTEDAANENTGNEETNSKSDRHLAHPNGHCKVDGQSLL